MTTTTLHDDALTLGNPAQIVTNVVDMLVRNIVTAGQPALLSLGYQVEATGAADLVAGMIQEVVGMANDEGRPLAGIEPGGMLPTDDGVRAWGMAHFGDLNAHTARIDVLVQRRESRMAVTFAEVGTSRVVPIHQMEVDLARNALVLQVQSPALGEVTARRNVPATLDIGKRGHLIGIELGNWYFATGLDDGATDDLVRSQEALVDVAWSQFNVIESVTLPRLAAEYEITFPVGNQCWQQHQGDVQWESCVVTRSR